MAYTPYYQNGWADGSSGGTPISAAALNNMENGIKGSETWESVPVTQPATGTVTILKNDRIKLAIAYWQAGGTAPSADSYSVTMPFSAGIYGHAAMANGSYLQVSGTTLSLEFGSGRNAWSVGSIVFPYV